MTMGLEHNLKMAGGARGVALSSIAHARSDIHWDDPHFERHDYEKWTAYGQAKTADALFALGVDARWQSEGVRAFAVHPGGIFTPLQRHLADQEMGALGWKLPDGTMPPAGAAMCKAPEAGAATSIWRARSPQLDGMGGLYCEDCDVAQLAGDDSPSWAHVRPWACSEEGADRLWGMTEAMLAGGYGATSAVDHYGNGTNGIVRCRATAQIQSNQEDAWPGNIRETGTMATTIE